MKDFYATIATMDFSEKTVTLQLIEEDPNIKYKETFKSLVDCVGKRMRFIVDENC